jgi:hypothetical protein
MIELKIYKGDLSERFTDTIMNAELSHDGPPNGRRAK